VKASCWQEHLKYLQTSTIRSPTGRHALYSKHNKAHKNSVLYFLVLQNHSFLYNDFISSGNTKLLKEVTENYLYKCNLNIDGGFILSHPLSPVSDVLMNAKPGPIRTGAWLSSLLWEILFIRILLHTYTFSQEKFYCGFVFNMEPIKIYL
jgi:hypothetical protein